MRNVNLNLLEVFDAVSSLTPLISGIVFYDDSISRIVIRMSTRGLLVSQGRNMINYRILASSGMTVT